MSEETLSVLKKFIRNNPELLTNNWNENPLESIAIPQDLELEYEYAQTYRELVDVLDALMTLENSTQKDTVSEIEIFHDYGKRSVKANKLEYLKQIQHVRKLVIESATATIPILRAVHQVEGLPTKEAGLAEKIMERDELSLEILRLQKEIDNKRTKLQEITRSNQKLVNDTKLLTTQLLNLKDRHTTSKKDLERAKRLKKELKSSRDKSIHYAEEIQLLIVEYGLNWNEDPELLESIELCSDIYRD